MAKTPAIVECPDCKGTGTTQMKVIETTPKGTTEKTFPMPCGACKSTGQTTKAKIRANERLKAAVDAMWCHCEGETDAEYFADGARKDIQKHHWRCRACGKVKQIG